MELVLSLLSGQVGKYLFYLIIIAGISAAGYNWFQKYVYTKQQEALAQYNITQLKQTIEDQAKHIQQMQQINNFQLETIAELNKNKEKLNSEMGAIEARIKTMVDQNKDRPSSDILKETMKELENIK